MELKTQNWKQFVVLLSYLYQLPFLDIFQCLICYSVTDNCFSKDTVEKLVAKFSRSKQGSFLQTLNEISFYFDFQHIRTYFPCNCRDQSRWHF